MAKWVRDRIDSRGRQPGDGGRKATDGGQKADTGGCRLEEGRPEAGGAGTGGRKADDGNRASVPDNPVPGRAEAPPDGHTCFFCAYACLMPRGRSFLMGMNLRRPLVCLNHPDAPGEFREVLGNSTCPNFLARREAPLRVPPPEPPNDKVKFIALTRGQHVMVDAADFKRLNRHKWCAVPCSGGSGYYAMRSEGGRSIFMHREIVNAQEGEVVDHANRCPWDNRQCNLRPCTQEENNRNRHTLIHSSRYQGVSYDRRWRKWVAFIRVEGRIEHIAASDDEVEAAKLRDRWAFAFYGRFAYLNFPADFAGKDPADPEFQALRDQLAEKRRKREERRQGRSKNGREAKTRGQARQGKGQMGKRRRVARSASPREE